MKRICAAFVLSLIFGTAFPAEAETPGAKDPAEAVPEEKQTVTEHSARIGGKNIAYTVTAGTMLMENADGDPHALMGFTAYVAKDGDSSTRPIMFAYNGGPGHDRPGWHGVRQTSG